ncbi:paeninodin family lasso peptide [Sporosarcina sp. NPDC096371]
MKKEWTTPELEVLDVHETMLGPKGGRFDSAHNEGDPFDPGQKS